MSSKQSLKLSGFVCVAVAVMMAASSCKKETLPAAEPAKQEPVKKAPAKTATRRAVPRQVRKAPPKPARVMPALLLHYTFEDEVLAIKVTDQSKFGRHGKGSAVTHNKAAGVSGKALKTYNRGTSVACKDKGLVFAGLKGITVSAWVKVRKMTTYGHVVTHGGWNEPGVGAFLFTVGGAYGQKPVQSLFGVQLEGGVHVRVSAPRIDDMETWHHVAGTYDGKKLRYYRNGVQVAFEAVPEEHSGSKLAADASSVLVIGKGTGKRWNWSDAHVEGAIDEVRIYGGALTAGEIKKLFDEFAGTG